MVIFTICIALGRQKFPIIHLRALIALAENAVENEYRVLFDHEVAIGIEKMKKGCSTSVQMAEGIARWVVNCAEPFMPPCLQKCSQVLRLMYRTVLG